MKNNLHRIIKSCAVLSLFLLLSFSSKSQTLYFCESVSDSGEPIGSGSSFVIPSTGGYLYFLVKLSSSVNAEEIHYSIYVIDNEGKEVYDSTVYQEVEEDWDWFYKKITFYHTGDYKVYVYDDYYNQLASGTVRIKM